MRFAKIKYGNLIKTIALTDFKMRYEGSVLGYVWSLAKPLLMFTVIYLVFSRVFNLGATIPHYPVYLLIGIVMWSFFSEGTQTLMGSIAGKAHIIRKVYFPRIVLPIANSLTALFVFGANFLIVILFMVLNGVMVGAYVLFLPLLFLQLYVLILGVGFFLSSLHVKYRDASHIWDVVLQAMFYATPILYPLELLPENARAVAMINPMAQIIQDVRHVMISDQVLIAKDILPLYLLWIPYLLPFGFAMVGYLVFKRSAASFAENV